MLEKAAWSHNGGGRGGWRILFFHITNRDAKFCPSSIKQQSKVRKDSKNNMLPIEYIM